VRDKSLNIGFIGAGNMAQALIEGMRRLKIKVGRIAAHDPDRNKLKKVARRLKVAPILSNREVAKICDVLVLATKPQEIKSVLQEIAVELKAPLIVSIAAGVETATLTKHLRSRTGKVKIKIVRAMPNNPALIGEGITALFTPAPLPVKERRLIEQLFKGAGEVLWVGQEADLDAVTGLSGSGPAYLYRFVEALSQGGVKMGLDEKVAQRLALKTVLGSALTLHQTGKTPSELIPLVTSKKGTTLAGLKVLDQKKFNPILHQTVRAATQRARQISKEIRKK
jgi:pyrroline-5-carboxylate reductase